MRNDDAVLRALRSLASWADTYAIAERTGESLPMVRKALCSLVRRHLAMSRRTGRASVRTEYLATEQDDARMLLEVLGTQTLRTREVAALASMTTRRAFVELDQLANQGKVERIEQRDTYTRHKVLWWRAR